MYKIRHRLSRWYAFHNTLIHRNECFSLLFCRAYQIHSSQHLGLSQIRQNSCSRSFSGRLAIYPDYLSHAYTRTHPFNPILSVRMFCRFPRAMTDVPAPPRICSSMLSHHFYKFGDRSLSPSRSDIHYKPKSKRKNTPSPRTLHNPNTPSYLTISNPPPHNLTPSPAPTPSPQPHSAGSQSRTDPDPAH